jgi:tetratricopeptide (TPR) repeat protein
MQFMPSMELTRRTTAGTDQAQSTTAETDRLIELSSWMMVLATIRLVCTIADYTSSFLEWTQGYRLSLRLVGRFFHENQPFFAVGIVWPLILAVAVRKTRWPELLKAVAATYLILSICGVLEFIAVWAHTRSDVLNVGSFHLRRRALTSPYFSEVILGLLGATQLLLESGVAVWSMLLGIRFRRYAPPESSKPLSARPARFGRLAVFVSLAFFVLVIRSSVWSAYLEVLNQSTIVREFVLRNDIDRIHSRHYRSRNAIETEQERHERDMQAMFNSGAQAWMEGRFATTRDSYLRFVSRIDAFPPESWTNSFRFTVANTFNNLAWLMATCPDARFRDAQGAVTNAKHAVEISPMDRKCWNTLGVAYYRTGELEEAKNALYRSMELRNEGDSFDWFFLACVHFKLGHEDRAREWYDRASRTLQQPERASYGLGFDELEELYRFEVEAADVIGIPRPAPPPSMIRDAMWLTGAEVLGVPVPAMSEASARFGRSRFSPQFSSLFRLNGRTPSPVMPTGKLRARR